MVKESLYNYLLKLDFMRTEIDNEEWMTYDLNNSYKLNLFFENEEEDDLEIGVYISHYNLKIIMRELYKDKKNSLAHQFVGKSYRLFPWDDFSSETLGQASFSFTYNQELWGKNNFKNSTFQSSLNKITLEEFSFIINLMKTKQGRYDLLFKHLFGKMLITDFWTFLFLCKELDFSTIEIENELDMPYLFFEKRSWGLNCEISREIIIKFSNIYEKVKKDFYSFV